MTKELELSKKLAVLGWIFRKGLITEDEYNRTRIHIMGEYDVISFMTASRQPFRKPMPKLSRAVPTAPSLPRG